MPIDRVAVLITSHNRRNLTLASLESLFRQRSVENLDVEVFLVDDGCTDGTGEAVRTRFPMVRVLAGDGNLYWNGGMRLGFAAAMEEGFDAYIFFNDDTILYKDALGRMVLLARQRVAAGVPAIVVGSTRSPLTGAQSYGGFLKRPRGAVLQLEMIAAHWSRAIPCDTMNGNVVLIPRSVYSVVGNIDEKFTHGMGDFDYGLRARSAGYEVFLAPGHFGTCSGKCVAGTFRDVTLSRRERLHLAASPKGLPVAEWVTMCRRHGGPLWPVLALSPYVRMMVRRRLIR